MCVVIFAMWFPKIVLLHILGSKSHWNIKYLGGSLDFEETKSVSESSYVRACVKIIYNCPLPDLNNIFFCDSKLSLNFMPVNFSKSRLVSHTFKDTGFRNIFDLKRINWTHVYNVLIWVLHWSYAVFLGMIKIT